MKDVSTKIVVHVLYLLFNSRDKKFYYLKHIARKSTHILRLTQKPAMLIKKSICLRFYVLKVLSLKSTINT